MLRVVSISDIPSYYPPTEHVADVLTLKANKPDAVEICWDKRQFANSYAAQPAYVNALKKFDMWDEYNVILRKDRLFIVKRTLCGKIADPAMSEPDTI